MSSLLHLVQQHPLYSLLGAYFLFSNAVGAMDAPTEKSGPLYRYIYRFGHGVAGNLKYAFKAKFPEYVEPTTETK